MADRTFALNIISDISDYQRRLAEIPGLTEREAAKAAQKLVDKMSKGYKDVGDAGKRAARDTASATAKASSGWADVAEKAGDSEAALIGVADLISMISPELGAAARAAADVGGGFEGIVKGGSGLLATLGPVALAVGAVTLAYTAWTAELERAAASARVHAQANDLVRESAISLRDATLELSVATRQISEAQAVSARSGYAARDAIVAQGAALAETRAEIRATISSYEGWAGALESVIGLPEQIGRVIPGLSAVREQLGLTGVTLSGSVTDSLLSATGAAEQVEELTDQLAYLDAAEVQAAKNTKATARAQVDAAAADRSRASAAEAATAAVDLYAASVAALEADLSAALAQSDLTQRVTGFAEALQIAAQTDPISQLARQREAALADLEALNKQRVDAAQENWAELLGLQQTYEAERAEVTAYYDAQIVARRSELEAAASELALKALQDAQQERVDLVTQTASTGLALLTELSDARLASLEEQGRAESEAGQRAFKFSQGLAIAQIAMNAAEGVSKAIAQFGLPFGLIPAGAIVALAGVQSALVASQSPPEYHTGGLISEYGSRGARGEVDIRALPGEGVVSRRGMASIGADGLQQLNQGRAPAQTVYVQYRHQLFDATVRDAVRVPGNPLNTATKPTTRRGIRG